MVKSLTAFRFYGRLGHMSVRKERRRSGREYWSAYRKYHHKQYYLYLGMTTHLSPACLEEVATRLQMQITSSSQGMPQV